MRTVRDRIADLHPLVLIGCGVLLFTFINIGSNLFIDIIYTPFAKNHGILLPFWSWLIGPALAITGMYPILGVSIVRAGYEELFSRWGMVLQGIVGPFLVIILWSLLHAIVTHLYMTIFMKEVRRSYAHIIFILTAYPAAFVGVWGGLVCYWLWNTVRSDRQKMTE